MISQLFLLALQALLFARQAPFGPSGSSWPLWLFLALPAPRLALQAPRLALPAPPVWACQPFSFGPSGNYSSWLARSRETLDQIHQPEPLQIIGEAWSTCSSRLASSAVRRYSGPGRGSGTSSRVVAGFARSGTGWWGGEAGLVSVQGQQKCERVIAERGRWLRPG